MNRFAKPLLLSAALCAAALSPARAEIDVARLKAAIATSLESDYPKLDALYKEIHAHPEIAFQEVKTAARPFGTGRRPLSPTAVAMTFTWQAGWARRRRWSA